jgi:formylglycine-generating enzyme required for sulfatase activity
MLRAGLCTSLCAACCLVVSAQPAREASRHAVLIVNAQYQHPAALPWATSNRQVMEDALQKTGFDVTVFENNLASVEQFDDMFLKKVKPGDIVLVFYSGYAVQSRMDNFLLPVGFDPRSTDPLVSTAVSLTRLQQDLDDQKASIKMLLVDAATNDPSLDTISSGPGLVQPPDLGSETCFLFSAGLNQAPAPVPSGGPGPLAAAFAKAIVQPGSELSKTMLEVVAALGNRPFFSNQVTQTFYFTAPPPPNVVKVEAPPAAVDLLTRIPQSNKTDRDEYRFIDKGTFQMGCVPAAPCEPAENPRHEVRITKSFWTAVTDVTVKSYLRFLAANKTYRKPDRPFWSRERDWSEFHPVVNVSWDDAQAYCRWVGGRLPTEAEWEYAARAGKDSEAYPLNSENSRDKANFYGKQGNDVYQYTSPVKSFDPNAWGLFDISGNVWQWTADWYDPAYFSSSPVDDPQGPAAGKERVIRGGSFSSDPTKHLRISYRGKLSPKGADNVGFRCILEDGPATRERFATGK